ncbi:MAG: hypothetical protein HZC42_01890 [Candidatus Eisenbacteria bacterium]|nr:hypothetical protein [Candidatus Eisenbacteria bacterium]
MIPLALAVIGLLLFSGLLALAWPARRMALRVSATGMGGACLLGLIGSAQSLISGTAPESLRAAWSLPIGELHVGSDALTAYFLLCISAVSGLAAWYGAGYLRAYTDRRATGVTQALFALLLASMVGVVIARDAVLFLVCWEVMTIASFFLVTFEDERSEVRRAGWVYLIASHVGVTALFVLFGVLYRHAGGSFDFARLAGHGMQPGAATACFLLAFVGFGTKAGLWPLHLWLPDAHPAAPSHVSAVMSGVMIKLGIYGLLRALAFLGPPTLWQGEFLLGIGIISALLGVLNALAQHDLKRLLAYHSVENMGIITIGLGLGLIGQVRGNPTLALLGYSGALLHVLNHGLFKSLLFEAAGSIHHATGTREMSLLGGLARAMPVTALCFLAGAIAICGLPPLNGFVSEWLVYLGAFRGATELGGGAAAASVAVIAMLALVGGLAVACFVKAYGVVFLGEPRRPAVAPHDASWSMRLPMALGALACVGIGLWPAGILALVSRPATLLAGAPGTSLDLPATVAPLTSVAVSVAALVVVLALVRVALLRRREVRSAATWACGYEAPSPRMQYTAASFAAPVLEPFAALLYGKRHEERPAGCFPERASHEVHHGDAAGERVLVPLVLGIARWLGRSRAIQHGRLQLYLVYILITLIALMAWQLSRTPWRP